MEDVEDTVKVDSLSLKAEARFNEGQIIGGKYRILSLAGKGGVGTVYRVQQIFLGKQYALKTLDSRSTSDSVVRRFQNEAKAASALSHPALVQVHDFGLLDDSQPYLVMDFVEGQSLDEYLKEHGPLEVETAAKLFAQICLGLSYAHTQGVVHRDIKPSNIMLVQNATIGDEGSAKVVDFGIAKLTTEGGEIQALTRTGEVFGSPLYMSPEQCIGAKVDQRTDVYSLGCVIFESLTGAPPHIGQTALLTMMMHQSAEPQTLSQASLGRQFPETMQNIVSKMLEKDPESRYPNLGVAAHDLAALYSGRAALSDFVSSSVKAPERNKTGRGSTRPGYFIGALVLTALVCTTVAGLSGYFIGLGQSRKAEPVVEKKTDLSLENVIPGTEADKVAIDKTVEPKGDDLMANYNAHLLDNKFTKPYEEARAILNKNNRTQEQLVHADELLQQCEKLVKSDDVVRLEQDPREFHSKPKMWRCYIALQRGYCAFYLHHLKQAEAFEEQAATMAAKVPAKELPWVRAPLARLDTTLGAYYFQVGKGREDFEKSLKYYKSALAFFKATNNKDGGIANCEHFIELLERDKLHNRTTRSTRNEP